MASLLAGRRDCGGFSEYRGVTDRERTCGSGRLSLTRDADERLLWMMGSGPNNCDCRSGVFSLLGRAGGV